ncbi:hypothetical protein G7Y89_g1009 [Cudoniella acicularis]|uniref:tetrahydrofolate synthase n=1 Tax=Cudoniella acicularis TaxID=354080 RepID=A0A8H4RX52_9HELO|nr:hypothetical protein G7Y89_g1009 [Cudoniella acicularis]
MHSSENVQINWTEEKSYQASNSSVEIDSAEIEYLPFNFQYAYFGEQYTWSQSQSPNVFSSSTCPENLEMDISSGFPINEQEISWSQSQSPNAFSSSTCPEYPEMDISSKPVVKKQETLSQAVEVLPHVVEDIAFRNDSVRPAAIDTHPTPLHIRSKQRPKRKTGELYHCPWEDECEFSHPPVTWRNTYSKYLDEHLSCSDLTVGKSGFESNVKASLILRWKDIWGDGRVLSHKRAEYKKAALLATEIIHKQMTSKGNRHQCPLKEWTNCTQQPSKQYIRYHVATHLTPYLCEVDQCKRSYAKAGFPSLLALQRHTENVHPQSEVKENAQRRRKTPQPCTGCRKYKLKCDGVEPSCGKKNVFGFKDFGNGKRTLSRPPANVGGEATNKGFSLKIDSGCSRGRAHSQLFATAIADHLSRTLPHGHHAMRIFLESPQIPNKSLTLRQAFAADPEATHDALNSALSDATSSPQERQLFNITNIEALLDILIPLQIEARFFRNLHKLPRLKLNKNTKLPLVACKQGIYTKGIEGLFMAYGELRAVVALFIAYQYTPEVVKAVVGATDAQRVSVVKNVRHCRFSDSMEKWREEFQAERHPPLGIQEHKLHRLETSRPVIHFVNPAKNVQSAPVAPKFIEYVRSGDTLNATGDTWDKFRTEIILYLEGEIAKTERQLGKASYDFLVAVYQYILDLEKRLNREKKLASNRAYKEMRKRPLSQISQGVELELKSQSSFTELQQPAHDFDEHISADHGMRLPSSTASPSGLDPTQQLREPSRSTDTLETEQRPHSMTHTDWDHCQTPLSESNGESNEHPTSLSTTPFTTVASDNLRYTPSFPVNNNLPSPLPLFDRPTANHTLASLLNTRNYMLSQRTLPAPAGRTLPYTQHQHLTYEWDERRPPAALRLDAHISADRTMTIPSPTPPAIVSLEPSTAFQKLDKHSRDLATLLVFLGEADVPKRIFLRAAQPKGFFSSAGDIEFAPALDLNPLFAHTQNLDSTLERLESLALIRYYKSLYDSPIKVQPKLRSLIGDATGDMKSKALLLVFHSFPINQDAETDSKFLFGEWGRSLLPHVQHVLRYFDTPGFFHRFSLQQREQIILGCLSSSKFGGLDWKWRVLATAEKLIETDQAHAPLSMKLRFRKMVLHRLYHYYEPDIFPTQTNLYALGEMSVFRAQLMIYKDELSQAWYELGNWNPLNHERTGEHCMLQKKICLQIKICRFAGDFPKAKSLLQKLKRDGLRKSTVPYYFTDFITVYCESGEFQEAISAIPAGDYLEGGWLSRRPSHAAAGTNLMKGLWILKRNDRFDDALSFLRKAKGIYEDLNKIYLGIANPTLVTSIRHFSVSAGLAMIAHVEGRFANTVTGNEALSYWKIALDLGQRSGKKLGGTPFPEMIIPYSMCDITSRLGLYAETTKFMNTAKSLYQVTGRQFQYLAMNRATSATKTASLRIFDIWPSESNVRMFTPYYHLPPSSYTSARTIVVRATAPSQRRLFAGKPRGGGALGRWVATEDAEYEVAHAQIPKVIHVAGTKGKGTTCYYCNRILVEHQRIAGNPRKIGCLTSPHQVDVRERILINNEKISKHLFSYYVRELDSKIGSLSSRLDLETPRTPKYPGFLSLLAIYIFILEKVDVAILETGLGGETDSTNVFPRPIATGITSIGLDHVDILGHTVEEIAWHKAGIFKRGSLAATVPQDEAVLQVLRKRAEERNVAGELQVITDGKVLEYGVKVDPDMRYQRYNAALAIFLAEAYLKSADPQFSMTGNIARSLQDVELLGKSQVLEDRENTWFVSSGHNQISLKETISWFKQSIQQSRYAVPRVLIFNSPRDPYPLLNVIHEGLRADSPIELQGVIFCTDQLGETGEEKPDLIDLRTSRKIISSLNKQKDNFRIWKELGGSGEIAVVHTAGDAIRLVKANYKGAEILVTGSGYLSGNILHILQSAT